ncbi:hypothetical protein A3Q56_06322 [Intoshia linei]|uniref:Integrase zinc-binding domain-containing protein n=1 Tax=Intoshia linei TaxID=1819745 RepID=A0A177AVB3_9BILA|nr:hypothetical protein A3Q56_06322 [Intoshia linei]
MANQLSRCCSIIHDSDDLDIALLQNQDLHCKEILKKLKSQIPISKSNKLDKNLRKYYVFNNILYYKSIKSGNLIVAPHYLRKKLIFKIHCGPQVCHPGIRSVVSIISRSFYCVGLEAAV